MSQPADTMPGLEPCAHDETPSGAAGEVNRRDGPLVSSMALCFGHGYFAVTRVIHSLMGV